MANNVRIGTQVTGAAKSSSDLDNLRDKFDKLQKQGAKGIGIGIAAGATSFALGAMQQAVSSATDVIGDAIQAARDDEVSIQKLGTALRDNVKDWDGNTDAIERTIKKRIALGFSDDEQRSGLATLVATTHDATKALELEQGAMDIARARGIDLASATDAVAKAYGGNTKSLKTLIPGLNLGKSSAQALANAFAAVRGSAQDFAATNEGKVAVSQAKVDEAMENFGYKVLPLVTEGLVDLADKVVDLSDTLDVLSNGFSKNTDDAGDQAKSILDLAGAFGLLIPGMSQLADASKQQIDNTQAATDAFDEFTKSGRNLDNMAGDVTTATREASDGFDNFHGHVSSSLKKANAAANDWRKNWHDDTGQVIRDSIKVRNQLASDAQAIIDSYFDPIEEEAKRHEIRMQLFADEEAKRTAKTKEDSRQASDAIKQDLDDEATSLVSLGQQGKLTQKDIDRFAKDAKTAYGKIPPEIQSIIDHLRTLAKLPNITKTITISTLTGKRTAQHPGGGGPQEFGSGGVVKGPPGSAQEAIVHAGEVVRTPAQEAALRSGSAGMVAASAGVTINVYPGIGTTFTAAEGRRLADAILPPLLAGMQRKGVLPRTATGLTG